MKMKLVAIALSGAMLASGAAFGVDFDPKFYVGGELQGSRHSGAKKITTPKGNEITTADKKKSPFGKNGSGASAFAGTKLNDNVGVELGYTAMSGTKLSFANSVNSSVKTKNRNMYADVLGFVPVSDEIDLIGSVGVGRLSTKACGKLAANPVTKVVQENLSMKSAKTGMRIGVGAQYKISPNIGARFMVRNQKGNKFVKSVNSAGLGMFYQF